MEPHTPPGGGKNGAPCALVALPETWQTRGTHPGGGWGAGGWAGAAGCLLGDVGEVVPPSEVVVADLVSGETAKRGMPGGGGGASICVGR